LVVVFELELEEIYSWKRMNRRLIPPRVITRGYGIAALRTGYDAKTDQRSRPSESLERP